MWTVELFIIAVMIVFNSVFAAYEIALASIGLARLDTLVRERRRGAAAAMRMKQNMEASLAAIQLGITLVGAVAAATGGVGAAETIGPALVGLGASEAMVQFLTVAIVVLPLTVVTILLGELVPKVFALRNTEWMCLRLSPMIEWFAYCVWPAVSVFDNSVRLIITLGEKYWRPSSASRTNCETALQELRAIAAVARTSRLIGGREEQIILNATRLSSTPTRSIVLPVEYISLLAADDSLEQALIAAHHDMHTRFPVTQKAGDPQSIIGYVNFKDIVSWLPSAGSDSGFGPSAGSDSGFGIQTQNLRNRCHLRRHGLVRFCCTLDVESDPTRNPGWLNPNRPDNSRSVAVVQRRYSIAATSRPPVPRR